MESMQRAIKQLTNEIIDLKKNKGEGKKHFKPFFKKKINSDTPPLIPPTSGINLKDYVMENLVVPIMQITPREHSRNL